MQRRPAWRDPFLILVGGILGIGSTYAARTALELGRDEPDVDLYRAVRDFTSSSYVRDVAPEDLVDHALRGMVEELDAYSRYYDRHEVAELDRETTGRYQGIGVVFRQPTSEGQVLFALPGSPADAAGLTVGDTLVEVDGRPVGAMADGELVAALTDASNDTLELRVRGLDGDVRDVRLERAELIDPTVRHARILDPEHGIGYVAIRSFSEETVAEFDRAFADLREQGLRSLVIDVRGNVGGVLRSAVEITNRFLEDGLIASTEGRGRPIRYEADAGEARYLGTPLVVLVDGESASASEVLGAALQEHRAAAVVGTRSYGKGMVQKMRTFLGPGGDPLSVVKLTSSYYYTPCHRNLERSVAEAWEYGITPDLWVELDQEERRVVLRHLARYSPPRRDLPAIRRWEQAAGTRLLPPEPGDAQLDAAADLLRGRRPGPYRAERS